MDLLFGCLDQNEPPNAIVTSMRPTDCIDEVQIKEALLSIQKGNKNLETKCDLGIFFERKCFFGNPANSFADEISLMQKDDCNDEVTIKEAILRIEEEQNNSDIKCDFGFFSQRKVDFGNVSDSIINSNSSIRPTDYNDEAQLQEAASHIEDEKNNKDIKCDLGILFQNKGDSENATLSTSCQTNFTEAKIKEAILHIEEKNKNSDLKCDFGNLFERKGNVKKPTLHSQKNSADTNYDLALWFQRKGDVRNAIVHFEKAISLDPTHSLAKYNLALVHYYQEHNLPLALKYFEAALQTNNNDVNTWINIGLVHRDLGNFQSSIQAGEAAIKIDPKSEIAFYNLGNIYHDFAMFDEAIQCYTKAIQINPFHADAFYNLGVVHQQKQTMSKARDCYIKAYQLNPKSLQAKAAVETIEGYFMTL